MDHITQHPPKLEAALTQLGLRDLLDGFIARKRVGVRFNELERYAAQYGYEFKREHGNIYGRLMLVLTVPVPTPVLRLVTRSDVAAVHGSRRRLHEA